MLKKLRITKDENNETILRSVGKAEYSPITIITIDSLKLKVGFR